MEWHFLFLYYMPFVLCTCGVASARVTETLDNNSDWKLAIKKIEELQMIVKFQEARISSLENRCNDPIVQVTEQERILKKQSVRITQLEARVEELETMFKEENVAYQKHARELLANPKQPSSNSRNAFAMVRIGKCKIMCYFLFEKKITLRWSTCIYS